MPKSVIASIMDFEKSQIVQDVNNLVVCNRISFTSNAEAHKSHVDIT